MGRTRFDVEVTGLTDTKRVMRQVAPDLLREMTREIRSMLQPVRQRAQGNVPADAPLSRWNAGSGRSANWDYDRLRWDASTVRRGIAIRQGGGRARGQVGSAAWALVNRSAPGSVFELMGGGPSNSTMTRNVNRKHGQAARVLWRAWDDSGAERSVPRDIAEVIEGYQQRLQDQLDGVDP